MRIRIPMLFLLAGATLLAACGGGSPAGPSADGGVLLEGTMLGGSAALPFRASAGSSAAADPITVSCQENPAITATVGGDGSFTLRGLPSGGFTLVFKQGVTTVGTFTFSEVKPNQEITITVALNGTTLTLVEQKRNGIGHGDLEIEGLVQQLLCGVTGAPACTTAGDSRFLIDGRTVVARPGQTAIREGNTARTVNDVTVGRRVHVKGTWLPAEGATQPVLASEIKLQDGDDDDDALDLRGRREGRGRGNDLGDRRAGRHRRPAGQGPLQLHRRRRDADPQGQQDLRLRRPEDGVAGAREGHGPGFRGDRGLQRDRERGHGPAGLTVPAGRATHGAGRAVILARTSSRRTRPRCVGSSLRSSGWSSRSRGRGRSRRHRALARRAGQRRLLRGGRRAAPTSSPTASTRPSWPRRCSSLDATRATPAERLDDGRDFVPTNRWVVLGHHFAAIAGPGPLVGPTLAAQFGYLPGTLWLVAGAVLGGCVQDFVILFFSLRRDGRSLGQMARDEVGAARGCSPWSPSSPSWSSCSRWWRSWS